jgi:DNA-binding MarR family transcriptional regulator
MSSRLAKTTAREQPENLAVERVPDPGDGRAKLVRATERGGEVYAIVREFVVESEARLTDRLGVQRMRRLREDLEVLLASASPMQ